MTVTSWTPRLAPGATPVYQAIADALERDIESGLVRDGQRLPTHRELAVTLELTPLTVTRAYKEAARRGLITSTVGRGTYVRSSTEPSPRGESGVLDLSKNIVEGSDGTDIEPRAVIALRSIVRDPEYAAAEGTLRHRTAAAAWMKRGGLDAPPERIVITPGSHQAMVAFLAAICRPGDTVLAEESTYPRFSSIAALLHLHVHTVELDAHGAIPQSFEKACRKSSPKAFYLIPNLQNPTGSVMPEKRRREIAAIARRHDVLLLEDNVYAFLLEHPPTPLAHFAPDHTAHLTSVSKSVSPSFRLGFMALPESLVDRVTAACQTLTAFTSTVDAELFTQIIDSGAADRTVATKRTIVSTNRRAADRALGNFKTTAHPMSPHLWFELPRGIDAHEIAERARQRGVAVSPGPSFSPARGGASVHAVRICIGASRDAHQIESAVRTVASIVMNSRLSSAAVV